MRKRLSILAVLLLAVAISAYSVGGTYAKYTTTANVTGKAPVAKWNVVMKANDTTVSENEEFILSSTITETDGSDESEVVAGKMAPGTRGSFSVELDASNTEVAFDYAISFTLEDAPTNVKFYSDDTYSTEISADSNVYSLAGDTVGLTDTKVINVPVYWQWAYETTNGDATDTSEGVTAADMLVHITYTATQAD